MVRAEEVKSRKPGNPRAEAVQAKRTGKEKGAASRPRRRESEAVSIGRSPCPAVCFPMGAGLTAQLPGDQGPREGSRTAEHQGKRGPAERRAGGLSTDPAMRERRAQDPRVRLGMGRRYPEGQRLQNREDPHDPRLARPGQTAQSLHKTELA